MLVEHRAQTGHEIGKRIAEILVFARAEAVPSHHDSRAERRLFGVEPAQRIALAWVEQRPGGGDPASLEVDCNARPLKRADPLGNG